MRSSCSSFPQKIKYYVNILNDVEEGAERHQMEGIIFWINRNTCPTEMAGHQGRVCVFVQKIRDLKLKNIFERHHHRSYIVTN